MPTQKYIDLIEITFAALAYLFLVLKYILIKIYTKSIRSTDLLLQSLMFISKQEIKNTFDRKVSKYYVVSNFLNKVAYLYFVILFIAYLFLKLI
jgi:hypothetical protein